MSKVLFILKRREDYDQKQHSHVGLSTGLYNSASFVHQMLVDAGMQSQMKVVIDNNDIDREVAAYRPTHVIIEALWVVPSKFAVLCKLHPNVTWIIRLHSDLPFLANEGVAMDWLADYATYPNVIIAANAPRMLQEARFYLSHLHGWDEQQTLDNVIYLPNFYPQEHKIKKYKLSSDYIDIGCFGAIRPLKNHLLQAIAAIKFAEHKNRKLRFHINAGRIEMKGEPILNNLKGVFQQLADKGHQLINHTWTPREQFLELCASMDIGMQVSLTETFNIVAADLISQGVPILVSNEVPWCNSLLCANPVDSNNIFFKMKMLDWAPQLNVRSNQILINYYTDKTRKYWLKYFSA